MKDILPLLILFLLILTLLCVPGLGIGFLLHWTIPAIDLGTGTLIGVVAVSASAYFFLQVMALLEKTHAEQLEANWSETGRNVLESMRPGGSRRSQRRVDR